MGGYSTRSGCPGTALLELMSGPSTFRVVVATSTKGAKAWTWECCRERSSQSRIKLGKGNELTFSPTTRLLRMKVGRPSDFNY